MNREKTDTNTPIRRHTWSPARPYRHGHTRADTSTRPHPRAHTRVRPRAHARPETTMTFSCWDV